VKGANILLTTFYNIQPARDKLMMERARWYQASLEAMYINDHPHVGRLIHPDHRSNLQTLLTVSVLRGRPGRRTCREQVELYRFEDSNFVRASSLSPAAFATASARQPQRQCRRRRRRRRGDADGRASPPLPAVQVGRRGGGTANLAPAGPAPAASPKPAGRGKGKRT
jgi:hypothetical protein